MAQTYGECAKCGTPFKPRRGTQRYCSKNCSNSVTASTRKGTLNSRYRHGKAGSKIYSIWYQIIARCTKPNHPRWKDYGGRGITICDAWKEDFVEFYRDVGDPPNKQQRWTIDRIDNNKGYEPGNVRWATYEQQAVNKRTSGWESRKRNEKGQFI